MSARDPYQDVKSENGMPHYPERTKPDVPQENGKAPLSRPGPTLVKPTSNSCFDEWSENGKTLWPRAGSRHAPLSRADKTRCAPGERQGTLAKVSTNAGQAARRPQNNKTDQATTRKTVRPLTRSVDHVGSRKPCNSTPSRKTPRPLGPRN